MNKTFKHVATFTQAREKSEDALKNSCLLKKQRYFSNCQEHFPF